MLDKYVWGKVSRISPEAPVPIVHAIKESNVPGGAANVAHNIAALGGDATLIGIVGDDEHARLLVNALDDNKINTRSIVVDKERPTIQKVRVIGHSQQLLRIDYEELSQKSEVIMKKLAENISKELKDSDVVIISDYLKGTICKTITENLFSKAAKLGIPVVVDPKPKNKLLYKGATVILPNHKEAIEMANHGLGEDSNIEDIGKTLLKEVNSEVVITRGEKGMSIFKKDGSIKHIATKAREVYDVSGAGDTVTAVIGMLLASGAELNEAAKIANYAAGIVVGKVGTSTASIEEIRTAIIDDNSNEDE